jgi:beta-hydroxylase
MDVLEAREPESAAAASQAAPVPPKGKRKKDRKKQLLGKVNAIFVRAEQRGNLKKNPAFIEGYADYPQLERLEAEYSVIRDECLRLLDRREDITDMEALGGQYTAGGVHTIQWKSFVLHAAGFVPENCARCPRTARLLEGIPGLSSAMFSILEPHQYIRPHWGYYKGFMRYHLGIVIPGDNARGECWLRVNNDHADNELRDKALIERGEKYYWRNGKGVFFDDTFLHDAANESDEVRIVLFIDIERKMPLLLRLFHRAIVAVAFRTKEVKSIRTNAIARLRKGANA